MNFMTDLFSWNIRFSGFNPAWIMLFDPVIQILGHPGVKPAIEAAF